MSMACNNANQGSLLVESQVTETPNACPSIKEHLEHNTINEGSANSGLTANLSPELSFSEQTDEAERIFQILEGIPESQKAANFMELIGGYIERLDAARPEKAHADTIISTLERGISTISDSMLKPWLLSNLVDSYVSEFERLGQLKDIDMAIKFQSRAVALTPDEYVDKPSWLNDLGLLYVRRLRHLGELSDIDNAIECMSRAVHLTPDGGERKSAWLNNLGIWHSRRFDCLGELADIDKAIACMSQVMALTTDGHADKFRFLIALGEFHWRRFEHTGNLEDINKAIEYQSQAVLLVQGGHSDPLKPLSNLGKLYCSRFELLGDLADIDMAIECLSQAVSLTPNEDTDIFGRLKSLGALHWMKFEQLGNLEDINRGIECQSRMVLLVSDEHPCKLEWVSDLGPMHIRRFEHFSDPDDIDKAIDFYSQTLVLTPTDRLTDKARLLDILWRLHHDRFERLKKLTDVDMTIDYLGQVLLLTPDEDSNKPDRLSSLGLFYWSRFQQLGEVSDVDKAINCHAQALSLTPEGHPSKPKLLDHLGIARQGRFDSLGKLEDIDGAIECQSQAMLLVSKEHEEKPIWFNNLGLSYQRRFDRLGELADIDLAIERLSEAVLLTPDGDAGKPARLSNLGLSYLGRFENLGKLSDIDDAINYHNQAIVATPDGHADRPGRLSNLGISHWYRFELLGELADIENAIQSQRQAVSLMPDEHADKPGMLGNLGMSHGIRFDHLGELVDLERAIELQRQAMLFMPDTHTNIPRMLLNLGMLYKGRFKRLGKPTDIAESVEYYKRAAQSLTGNPSTRLAAARAWARMSAQHQISSPLEAYQHVMSLIPQVVWLGTTINRRYKDIASVGDVAGEAAAVAIALEDYNEALERLEQGRSIVWNQLLQLRTPVEQLSLVAPVLAQKLKEVAHSLENASSPKFVMTPMSSNQPTLEEIGRKHRDLADKWEKLVNEARTYPGLQNFLKHKEMSELVQAAQSGAIVMINVHKDRCDALALLPGSTSVVHIPLVSFSYEKAAHMRTLLLGILQHVDARTRNSRHPVFYQINKTGDEFETMLSALWSDVAKPILAGIGYLEPDVADELPRVTWCTTGPLAFLPLHAAGYYDEPRSKVFDYVVSSYTPTISALLKLPQISSRFSGILAVGQETTAGCSPLPGTVAELDQIQKQARDVAFTRLEGDSATSDVVLDAMEKHSWVHLACHASQNVADPTTSAFHLYDGELDLAEITRKSLKSAEFAFLSACQTATGDENLPDEAVHLAAGMIMAGYSSVVATMWSIEDQDAPLIAEKVYGYMLEGGVQDVHRAARALHGAVGCLREKVGEKSFARWVPYIHIGQ